MLGGVVEFDAESVFVEVTEGETATLHISLSAGDGREVSVT